MPQIGQLMRGILGTPGAVSMGQESPRPCPTCQRVPLTLFYLSGGTIEHARVGCLCGSVILHDEESAEPPSREAGNVNLLADNGQSRPL